MNLASLPSATNVDTLYGQSSTADATSTPSATEGDPSSGSAVTHKAAHQTALALVHKPAASSASAGSAAAAVAGTTSTAADALVSKETAQLIADLASGNVYSAQADIAKLQNQLKTREAASTKLDDSELSKVLAELAKNLSVGDTGSALTSLTGFLVENGSESGSLLDTAA